MSAKKNKEILESITKANYLSLNKKAIVDAMLKQEVAGQRVFYVFLKQQHHDYKITPENMDKDQSDGIVGNTIIECKLNDKEGGGIKKAYKELYDVIPTRLKQKGEKIPFYRIYVELETFLVEVYDCQYYETSSEFKRKVAAGGSGYRGGFAGWCGVIAGDDGAAFGDVCCGERYQ